MTMKETCTNLTIQAMINDMGDVDSAIYRAVKNRSDTFFNDAIKHKLDGYELRYEAAYADHLTRMASRRASDAMALYRMAMNKIELLEMRISMNKIDILESQIEKEKKRTKKPEVKENE